MLYCLSVLVLTGWRCPERREEQNKLPSFPTGLYEVCFRDDSSVRELSSPFSVAPQPVLDASVYRTFDGLSGMRDFPLQSGNFCIHQSSCSRLSSDSVTEPFQPLFLRAKFLSRSRARE